MNNKRRGLPLARAHVDQIFPKLTPAQIRRIAARGKMRAIERGDVLYEQGDSTSSFFVVVSGELEVYDPRAPLRPLLPFMLLVNSRAKSARCLAGGLSFACAPQAR